MATQAQIQELLDQGYSEEEARRMLGTTMEPPDATAATAPTGQRPDQYFGDDPNRQIKGNREYAYGEGEQLKQESRERALGERLSRRNWDQYGADVYDPLIGGRGGYSEEEQQDILREGDLRAGIADDSDYEQNFLTPDEWSASQGNPWDRAAYFNPEAMSNIQTDSEGRQRGAVGGLRTGMAGAIRPEDLRLSGEYGTRAEGALAGTEEGVRGAIDPTRLTVSRGFSDDYAMTPEEQQRIVTGAGITTGNIYRDQKMQLERRARAAGVDPLGVAAAGGRLTREGAGEAGDAMTLARIRADETAAGRAKTSEQMRLGAEQDLAGLRTGTELTLGQRRLGQVGEAERLRLAAEQGLSDREMEAARVSGQADIQSEQAMNDQRRQQEQYNASQGTEIATGIERDAAARNLALAQNRQRTNAANVETRYSQGRQTSADLSARSQQIAAERAKQAAEGREYVTNRAKIAGGYEQSEYDRQASQYGTTGQLGQGTTGQQLQWATRPRAWETVLGAAAGVAGAAVGGRKGR
mgnify:CR=1 FL=1